MEQASYAIEGYAEKMHFYYKTTVRPKQNASEHRPMPKPSGPRKTCPSMGKWQNLNACKGNLEEREAKGRARRKPQECRKRVGEMVHG
jgi:hypothetical protein